MKRRFNNFSIYRIIATLLIIEFHISFILSPDAIPYETLLSKAVQGLTALSGFLYAKKELPDRKKFYLGTLKKLILPAIVCFLFVAIWNLVYLVSTGAGDYIALFFDRREYNGSLLFQTGNFYYLFFIYICYLITPLLKNARSKIPTVITVVAAELLISFFSGFSIIISAYLVGYLVGERWGSDYTDNVYRPSAIILPSLIFLLSLGIYALTVHFDIGESYFPAHIEKLLENLTASAVGTSSFFLVCWILKPLNSFNCQPFLQYTDRLMLSVFLFNQAFICGATDVTEFTDLAWLKPILVFAFTIGAAILTDAVANLLPSILIRSDKK